MSNCRASGGDCSNIINTYTTLNQDNRAAMQNELAEDPLTVSAGTTKSNVEGGLDAASRPNWLYGSLDNEDVKNYILEQNSYDLNYINTNTSMGVKALSFIGEPENVWGLLSAGGSLFTASATLGQKAIGMVTSYGANAGVQVLNGNTGEKFDYLSFFSSGVTGAAGVGKSLNSNLMLNVGSAYFNAQLTGKDATASMIGSALGTGIGYAGGSAVTNQLESKVIKDQFGMEASKNALKYAENPLGNGYLFKGAEIGPVSGILGGATGAVFQESVGNKAEKNINKGNEK